MLIKLYNGDITLPNDLNIEERNALVNSIIIENSADFSNWDSEKVKIKLDILSTYILQGDNTIRKDKTIMSRYKERRRPFQEMSISNLSGNKLNRINNDLYSTVYIYD